MKKLLGTLALLAAAHTSAYAQSLDDLKRDGKGGNTDNVLTYGMGYHQQRYSTLKQIDKTNVKRLVPVWSTSLSSNYGEQGQPLVYNGVMFVANAENTIAIDVATGKQLWRTPVDFDAAVPRVVC
jgi:alcohol dehydrogenase (cytochrome c)